MPSSASAPADPGRVRSGRTALLHLRLGWLWLPAAPLFLVLLERFYLPILAPALASEQRWLLAMLILGLLLLSLLAHCAAHILAATALAAPLPPVVRVGLLGDPAHCWQPTTHSRHEAAIVCAGLAVSLVLALGCGLLWRVVLDPALDAVLLFVAVFNAGLFAANLAPGYPFDGGRLLRLLLLGLVRRPAQASRITGMALASGVLLWGVLIALTRGRFWAEMSLALGGLAILIGLPLRHRPAPSLEAPPLARSPLRLGLTLAACLGLLAVPLLLLPLPYALYAPGDAVSVAPMIEVDTIAAQPSEGALLLTTVIGQTPIVLAQWLLGRLDPAITLVAPEYLVPPETTLQAQMIENNRMLVESELIASMVALRLAGYEAAISGSGAVVQQVLADSPAHALLRPGDRIVAVDGAIVRTTDDLLLALRQRTPPELVELTVLRDAQTLRLSLPLLEPIAPGGPPRIGLAVTTADLVIESPLAVVINPQGVLGGPSAGLMFTLAIYDRLTPADLTAGRRIAGTGTVDLEGRIGPIGGVEQKVAAAERAGATLFLVPPANAAAARQVADQIVVIEVATVREAVQVLLGAN